MIKIIAAVCSLLAGTVLGATFEGNKKRTVLIDGVVSKNILNAADKLLQLIEKNKEPVTIIINSPGGSVATGMQFIGAMEIAQAQGVTLRCLVPYAAASMAFIIYAKCDERYALPRAMFLWHGISLKLSGRFQIPTLEFILHELKMFRQDFLELQLQATGIEVGMFLYYYENEAWVTARRLDEITTDFFTIVYEVKGVSLKKLYGSYYGARWWFDPTRGLVDSMELRK